MIKYFDTSRLISHYNIIINIVRRFGLVIPAYLNILQALNHALNKILPYTLRYKIS